MDNADNHWTVLDLTGQDFASVGICNGFTTLVEHDWRWAHDVWSMIDDKACWWLANQDLSGLMNECFSWALDDFGACFDVAWLIGLWWTGFQWAVFNN